MPESKTRRRRVTPLVSAVLVAVLLAVAVAWWLLREPASEAAAPQFTPSAQASPSPETEPTTEATPEPAVVGFPVDANGYDLSALPALDARAVVPTLDVDSAPLEAPSNAVASPTGVAVPVFRAPGEAPVAQLRRDQQYDGSTVPVVEQQEHWLRVLLPARSGLPSQGVTGQQTGWVRAADVTVTASDHAVSVNLTTGEIVVTGPDGQVTMAGFGYGTAATPTPVGRTYIMTMFTEPALTYTRGLPVVALAVQSPTLDGFSGQDVAVTAFHYHDARAGAISNGCIRVDEATIRALAALPLGTPVVITA